jgi:hypothetical protein
VSDMSTGNPTAAQLMTAAASVVTLKVICASWCIIGDSNSGVIERCCFVCVCTVVSHCCCCDPQKVQCAINGRVHTQTENGPAAGAGATSQGGSHKEGGSNFV